MPFEGLAGAYTAGAEKTSETLRRQAGRCFTGIARNTNSSDCLDYRGFLARLWDNP
jgi:hypothetical protein